MAKFNYKQAEQELAQHVTHENGMLYVNGVARMICQGYLLKTVIYNATNVMEDNGADALTAVNQAIAKMVDNYQPNNGEYTIIEPELEAEILATSPVVAGSIMATRNGFCAKSGWPIIAGTHNIIAGQKYNAWIRTDKM